MGEAVSGNEGRRGEQESAESTERFEGEAFCGDEGRRGEQEGAESAEDNIFRLKPGLRAGTAGDGLELGRPEGPTRGRGRPRPYAAGLQAGAAEQESAESTERTEGQAFCGNAGRPGGWWRRGGAVGVVALGFWLGGVAVGGAASSVLAQFYSPTNFSGMVTDGPAVYSVSVYARTNIVPGMWASRPPPPDSLPLEVRERWMRQNTQTVAQVWFFTNKVFEHFEPTSLNYLVWTNFIAHTNGRSGLIWSERVRPAGWPAAPPVVRWNREGLMWGMKGLTALSPCWESEGNPGQVPITALTRRHGYTRGHSMGADGFNTNRAGQRVWFLTTDDKVVQVVVKREVVRTVEGAGRDYTIVLFDRDLPSSIVPIRVTAWTNMTAPYAFVADAPCPLFMTEQGGSVSAQVEGFKVPVWKGGDSGSPNMFPLPGELVFYGGRSTSGPSAEMQADMDELCRREGLNPRRYRMSWVDLNKVGR